MFRSVKKTVHTTNNKFERSLISKEYIKWFIQEYIFEDVDFNNKEFSYAN